MSVIVIATIIPIAQHWDEVLAAFTETIARVHEEPGCELYALHRGPDRLVMIEKWESRAALEVHQRASALADLGPRLAGRVAAALDVQILEAHPAGTATQGAL